MALSAFPPQQVCVPPTQLLQLAYDATTPIGLDSASVFNTYSTDNGTLIINNQLTIPTQCNQGVDIVFLVDYTGSMGGSINGVKAGIANILSTINAESSGDFRIGLCIFDETTSSSNSNYGGTSAYTSLPANQKVIINSGSGKNQHITCLQPMNIIGNTSEFQTKLALLNTGNLPLGSGQGTPEPGGLGVNEIVANSIAGSFRSNAIKVIILITDAIPGGFDDATSTTDQTYFNNVLIPLCDTNGVQALIQSSRTFNSGGNYYNNLALGTTPLGRYDYVSFDTAGSWINTGLIAGIEGLCDESYIPGCSDAPVGWYYQNNSPYATYFNGSTFTNSYFFPATYNIVGTPTMGVNENNATITFTTTTTYVANGTTLYWNFGNTETNASDYIENITSGSFTINNNSGSFTLTTRPDGVTEGVEQLIIALRTGSTSGTIVDRSNAMNIEDTSMTPTATPIPCYEYTSIPFDDQFWVNYIDCNGVAQYYYTQCGSICRHTFCARSITSSSDTVNITGSCTGELTPTSTQSPPPPPTPTPIPPTPTATDIPTGSCQNTWINNNVSSQYGIRWRDPSGTYIVKNFNQLLSTSGVWRNGVEGYVVSVCSNEVTEAWDFVTNTIVFLSSDQFERLASGGICTANNDCMYDAPSPTATAVPPTATPYPTGTPIPPTATPFPTATPAPSPTSVPNPTATAIPPTATSSGGGAGYTWSWINGDDSFFLNDAAAGSAGGGTDSLTFGLSGSGSEGRLTPNIVSKGTNYSVSFVYGMFTEGFHRGSVNITSLDTGGNTSLILTDLVLSHPLASGVTGTATGVLSRYNEPDPEPTPFPTATSIGSPSGGGGGCLLEGTLVSLANGTTIAIEELITGTELSSIIVGDMPNSDDVDTLLTWSQANPTLANTTTSVTNNKMSVTDTILNFNNDLIKSSAEHLHIIKRNNICMVVKANTIRLGDSLISGTGSIVLVTSVQVITGMFKVYELDVETNDTFIANGILTHNAKESLEPV